MNDKKIKKISSQIMELRQLIAGPLIATIEADALSAQKYLDYLMNITFESYNPVTGETGKLRMLTFSFIEHDINGSQKKSVSIPLMTLVPLPLLQVQEADFDFDVKIIDALSECLEETLSMEQGTYIKEQQNVREFRMRASLAPQYKSSTHEGELQQSLAANMKVKVNMRQTDIPAGLSKLLHIATNNFQIENAETINDYEGITNYGNREEQKTNN